MMPRVSVIVITLNEAHRIAECLDSVRWADEIVVLDSGSSDSTVEICRRYTPHVFEGEWPGFGVQKNRALARATGEWVLSLDADERVSPALAEEIRAILPQSSIVAYDIPRQSTYLGCPIRFGDWRSDLIVRLFRRAAARFTEDIVHEKLVVDGPVGHLQAPIFHDAYPSLETVLDKMNRYSSASARQRLDKGQRASLRKAIGHGLWTFVRGYLLRGGFMDGREGFLLALSNSLGCFYRYVKLIYLGERRG